MTIRQYEPADCECLANLFYHTVHTINAKDYSKEQLNAWATGNVDLKEWNTSLFEHYTVVAIEENIIVGFGDIDKKRVILTGYMLIRTINGEVLQHLFAMR